MSTLHEIYTGIRKLNPDVVEIIPSIKWGYYFKEEVLFTQSKQKWIKYWQLSNVQLDQLDKKTDFVGQILKPSNSIW